MTFTAIVRAILREHPESRYDVTYAYLVYLGKFVGATLCIETLCTQKLIGIQTFLRIWQRHRRSFI